MNAERAEELGRAFALGFVYGHGVLMAQDEARWITVHPNGTGANANGDPIKGRPLLIDDETGSILGGMGGKGKGKKLTDFKTSRKKMTFKSSGSASKPAKPHHNNPSLAGSGPFAAMRELNQLQHSASSAGTPPASAAQPQVSAPAPASASGASGSEAKETNGLKIKQPEKSEISLPKPAAPANWREMSYGEQFAAKMDMQKQFLTPDLDYSKLSEKDLNTYERVAKEAANERDRYFDGKTVTTNADLAQKRLDQIQDYKTYRGSALKSQEAAADVRQYGKLWESSDGRVKRLYLKPYNLGLKTEKYKTGNIKNATVNGEPISNSKASGLLNMEAYINLKTGKLEGSDAREFSKYFGKDIDKIISDNFSAGDAS